MKNLKLDKNGHLSDYTQWTKDIALELAKVDKIKLSNKHWQIINLVRDIYIKTETTPPMRLLIKAIKINVSEKLANSRHLYQLFPDGPVKFASKYAGLPKPKHCL